MWYLYEKIDELIFHYYLVYIHPFSDGNGRMAMFWVSLILTKWNSKFEYIPIEEELYINQKEYYSSIDKCHINGNANEFISFMLKCINSILDKTTQETTQENYNLNDNQRKIIELMKENPRVTRNELASKLDITSDGVRIYIMFGNSYNCINTINYYEGFNNKKNIK